MFSIIEKSFVCSKFLPTTRLALHLNQPNPGQTSHFSKSSAYCYDIVCPPKERGLDYLRDTHLNKGLAFTMRERQALGLCGLLASNYLSQKDQIEICSLSFDRYADPLNQYLYMSDLLDTNERLFYSLISTDVAKYMPIVYTPTVGLACQKFGLTYRKPKGLFITIHDKGRIFNIIKNWPISKVRAICVTDGERILGLGDLGAYGMGIPIGKLCLYTALAGVKPHRCLPITLDVGTNNENLLVDPLYIGVRQKRVRGECYDEFIDEFLQACVKRYGVNTLIQFEDFALANATRLLKKYQKCYCTFNDDIQGTAATIVAGIYAATRVTKKKISENVFLFLGAGSAGTGIAELLVDAMIEEGISKEEARKKIYFYDVDGLLTTKRQSGIPPHATDYARDLEPSKDFLKSVCEFKATCIIGVSTVGGTFTPDVLKAVAKNAERPMVFALSNPTHKAECTPQQAYDHTEGRCIFASGSPFPPVKYGGKTYNTGQGNNAYVFPGMALGVIAGYLTSVSNNMVLTAAKTLAGMVVDKDLEMGRIYPPIHDIKKISFEIAKATIATAYKENLVSVYPKPEDIGEVVKRGLYDLTYPCYAPDFYDYPENTEIKVKSVKDMIETYRTYCHENSIPGEYQLTLNGISNVNAIV